MFKKLCGEDSFQKVILITTMWTEISPDGDEEEICVRREEELLRQYWADMISRGSLTRRFRNAQISAWDILDHLICAEYRRRLVRVQEKLAKKGRKLPSAEAGQRLHGTLGELMEKQNELLERMKDELEQTSDLAIVVTFLNEVNKLQKRQSFLEKLRRTLIRFRSKCSHIHALR